MLRQSYTAVVERAVPLSGEFTLEPYEAGWAGEAIVFIKVREEPATPVEVQARIQISPDGIDWVDEGTVFPPISGHGLYFVRVRHFGNWLRVAGQVSSAAAVKAMVYVVLKE